MCLSVLRHTLVSVVSGSVACHTLVSVVSGSVACHTLVSVVSGSVGCFRQGLERGPARTAVRLFGKQTVNELRDTVSRCA